MKRNTFLYLIFLIFFSFALLAFVLFYNSESLRMDIISGIGNTGDKWERTLTDGQKELIEIVKAGPHNDLRAPSNGIIHNSSVKPDGSYIFNINYFYDEFGRRIIKDKKHSSIQADRFALFFGCSDLLGAGVTAENTIPEIFETNIQGYKSYNYGFPGTGAHYLNRFLETTDIKKEVSEKNGILVYVMTEGHYPKSLGKLWHIIRPVMPKYTLHGDTLQFLGPFIEVDPVSSFLYKYLGTSWLRLQLGNVNRFTDYTEDEDRLVCRMLKTAKDNFFKQYPNSRFILFLHTNLPPRDRSKLKECAAAEKIESVDADMYYDAEKFDSDPVYRHPTKFFNEVLSKKLIDYMEGKK
jgi:hypothetical protein